METNEDNKKKVVDSKEHKKFNKNKDNLKIKELEEKLNIEKEKSMRIQAEMMNYTRRKDEEVSNMYKYANEDILKKLISIHGVKKINISTDLKLAYREGIMNSISSGLMEEEGFQSIKIEKEIHNSIMNIAEEKMKLLNRMD